MRLDEWKRYLNEQFLDEPLQDQKEAPVATAKQQGAATAPATPSLLREEPAAPLSLFAEETVVPTPLFSEETVRTGVSHGSPAEVETASSVERVQTDHRSSSRGLSTLAKESAALTSEERQLLEAPFTLSDLESRKDPAPPVAAVLDTQGGAQAAPRRVTMPTGSAVTSAFVPLDPAESTIPGFDRYLPPSHAASSVRREEVAETVVVNTPPVLQSGITPGSSPVLQPGTAPGPSSVLMPMATYLVTSRRAPSRRARHARNVIPEKVTPGLSAAELWAEVPRHVQTLLALGRMEDESEIAQFSYKRPFQEKRIELIARLLDPILSLEEAARLLNVCPTTVRRYTNKGILNHYRKEPDQVNNEPPSEKTTSEKETRQRRFRLSDILTFLEAQQAALKEDKQSQVARRPRKNTNEPLATQEAESRHTDSTLLSESQVAS